MPLWLQRQLKKAFLNKDRRQILILNECWYLYRSAYLERKNKSNQTQSKEKLRTK